MVIDPVAITLWGFPVRWYSLAYIVGFMLAWFYVKSVGASFDKNYALPKFMDDFVLYSVLGVIVGGRLGYVLVYDPSYYLANKLDILCIWNGGMSFHGGLVGVMLSSWVLTRKYRLDFVRFLDVVSPVTCLGLMLGRIANFVNGELYGRFTDVPWGVVFPRGGEALRHPTQLYEAALEGLVLFLILHFLLRRKPARGLVAGCFAVLYGLFRIFIELFREPDAHLGYIAGSFTMGQLLTIPMLLIGAFILFRGIRSM